MTRAFFDRVGITFLGPRANDGVGKHVCAAKSAETSRPNSEHQGDSQLNNLNFNLHILTSRSRRTLVAAFATALVAFGQTANPNTTQGAGARSDRSWTWMQPASSPRFHRSVGRPVVLRTTAFGQQSEPRRTAAIAAVRQGGRNEGNDHPPTL